MMSASTISSASTRGSGQQQHPPASASQAEWDEYVLTGRFPGARPAEAPKPGPIPELAELKADLESAGPERVARWLVPIKPPADTGGISAADRHRRIIFAQMRNQSSMLNSQW